MSVVNDIIALTRIANAEDILPGDRPTLYVTQAEWKELMGDGITYLTSDQRPHAIVLGWSVRPEEIER